MFRYLWRERDDKDPYAYGRNIVMLINAGFSGDELQTALNDLYDEKAGVYLQNNKQKLWVKRKAQKELRAYEIYGRDLKITASDDNSYWEWTRETIQEGNRRFPDIEVACLKQIRWLEVGGKFSTVNLTAGAKYKVSFMLKGNNTWDKNLRVTFRLNIPGYGRQEKQLCVQQHQWMDYQVGEFQIDRRTIGNVEFQMEQLDPVWKSGLMIKGVKIEPVM